MSKNGLIYDVHEKAPFGKNLLFAFQQVLAILAATVLVPILVDSGTGRMSQASALIGAGVGTIVYILFTKTFFNLANLGRPSSLSIFTSPWISGRA